MMQKNTQNPLKLLQKFVIIQKISEGVFVYETQKQEMA